MSEQETRQVIETLYAAHLSSDQEAMLALMSNDVEVRFLGQAHLRGIEEARRFFEFSGSLLGDLDFRIRRMIVDGEWGAVLWDERAITAGGVPWDNHGVDVLRVVDGRIVVVHENSDVGKVRQHLPRYEGPQTKRR